MPFVNDGLWPAFVHSPAAVVVGLTIQSPLVGPPSWLPSTKILGGNQTTTVWFYHVNVY